MRKMLVAAILMTAMAFPNLHRAEAPLYLPILMYHQISENPARLGSYVISTREFENDLKLLAQHGFTTITPDELFAYYADGKPLPEKPVMLTFDDGFESDYAYAFPLLQKYNMKAAFAIIGRYTDMYSGDVPRHISYAHLSWDQVKEMHDSGLCAFVNHSYDMHETHGGRRGALKRQSESVAQYREALTRDLGKLNDAYKEHIGAGEPPLCFVCPLGDVNDQMRDALREAGYAMVMTCTQTMNKLTGDPDEMYRLGRYLRAHGKDMDGLVRGWEKTIARQS